MVHLLPLQSQFGKSVKFGCRLSVQSISKLSRLDAGSQTPRCKLSARVASCEACGIYYADSRSKAYARFGPIAHGSPTTQRAKTGRGP
jgi:hypothetical protein